MRSFQLNLEAKVVAIDGKTMRHSFDKESRPLHMVSTFASEAGLVLGQEKVAEKSNEITAIPKLLELLDLTNAVVTIDAMGCQYEIADKIRAKKADYLLALKGNQGELHEDVKLAFVERIKTSTYLTFEDVDGGHGRIETRRCTVTDDTAWLQRTSSQMEKHSQHC